MQVGIVGTGTMARGIARLLVQRGIHVVVVGRTEGAVRSLSDDLVAWLERQREKGKLTDDESASLQQRLTTTTELRDLSPSDYIIEAVAEELELKRETFRQLEAVSPARVPLASNTSSIPIERISLGLQTAGRIIGVHFMNPAHVMPLVEVIASGTTSKAIVDQTVQMLRDLGKEPMLVPDRPGFVLNRVLFAALRQAMMLVEDGTVDCSSVDKVLKLGANHPMGPLELADFIGLDVCLAVFENLKEVEGGVFLPPAMLVSMVKQGRLGRKSGEGFHQYSSP